MGLRFFNFDNHVIKLLELRHATILLTAIRWYELEHHCWPENLYELVPEYLSKLPIDPNTGTDWIYTINDSQLTLAVQHENTQNIIVEMDLD